MNPLHAQIAARLRHAQETRTPIDPIADDLPEKSIDAAYAIQAMNIEHAVAQGRRVVGCKIGLTSAAVQRQLGVDQPDFGMLLADTAYADGQEVPTARLLQPKAEGEIALVLAKNLDKEYHTVVDVLHAVDYALPALEIVDSRIRDWKISILDTIADNASSGLFVLGTRPVSLRRRDLALCGMSLFYRGEPVSTGVGLACLGNPLNAAVWLANTMARRGQPLRAGDIILTGALGPVVPVPVGESLELKINGLGKLTARFI
jgi:2-keto-4-pentenoate hydratase